MKRIKCQLCNGAWMIEKDDLEKQKVCPYCGNSVQGKVEFETYDSLDKAIYSAVIKMGEGVLQNPRQLLGFMMDIAPNLKKEIRIFSKIVTGDYVLCISSLFNQDLDIAEITIRKLRQLFIEEEGLSESWADIICDGFHGALFYYKGIGCTRLINVEVEDFELSGKATETKITASKQYSVAVKSNLPAKTSSKSGNVTNHSNLTSSSLQNTASGIPEGLCELAVKYYNGTDPYKRDEKKAIKLFRESANYYQYVPAYNYLGRIFMRRRKCDSASKWYQKSAAANNPEGLCMMGYFYQKGYGEVQQNVQSALGCYAAAAATGDFDQMIDIARKFLEGVEVPQEEEIAVNILDEAAKSGSTDAQFYLAKCYQNGTGVNVDIGKAIALYKMASADGHKEAKFKLQDLQETLSFTERLYYKIRG